MLESAQIPDQNTLVAFVKKGITSLESVWIERVKIYGKSLDEEFPAWNQEFEIAGKRKEENIFTFEADDANKNQLKTKLAQDVLEQFMNLKARTSIGINYNDLPPVIGMAKLAVQKFERSPDSQASPYLTELIQKIMLYYEHSLVCFGQKVKRSSVGNAIFIGLGTLTGIAEGEPLGRFMASEFPHVEKSFIHGLYNFDVVLSTLWLKAGELTDELHDILNNNIDLETLDLKHKSISHQVPRFPQAPEAPIPKQTTNSPDVGSIYIANQKRVYAGFCGIFLGAFGIHKFILGYKKQGIIMLCTTLLLSAGGLAGIVCIVGIIEGIIYLSKSEKEFLKIYVNSQKTWF
jgi:TM2 domain-containing membrane protein YozV